MGSPSKSTCDQCGGEVEIIWGGPISYRCRCGVIGKWWQGEHGEDEPPQAETDVVISQLEEMRDRIDRLTQIMTLIDTLRLHDDIEADVINSAMNANRWLMRAEDKLRRYYSNKKLGFLEYLSREPLELIDADAVIKAALAKPEEPA